MAILRDFCVGRSIGILEIAEPLSLFLRFQSLARLELTKNCRSWDGHDLRFAGTTIVTTPPMASETPDPPEGERKSVRRILVAGVFWRILAIEMILLVWSLGWRAFHENAGPVDLFWYAVRIVILIIIIIAFVTLSLRRFLSRHIILPLEAVTKANLHLDTDAPEVNDVPMPPHVATEIKEIVDTRQRMLASILKVSSERLRLVNFIRETFGRYLSKKVVDEILASQDGYKIGGRRETVTILMADLRGFTSIADTQDPEQTVQMLNRFFGAMAEIIVSYDGTIDEFLGDGILTIFGVPERHDDDPARAVACALEMQNMIVTLNAEIAAQGYPPLSMGIGIHTGTVIVGNIGSEIRAKYGIVGRAVNIAGRIESLTTGGQVLISDATHRMLDSVVDVAPAETFMMKGLSHPLVCFPVKSIRGPYRVAPAPAMPEAKPVRTFLPLICWVVEDKQIVEPGFSGQTLSMTENDIDIALEHPIVPLTDVKVQLNFCAEAHCFDAIYAKVHDAHPLGNRTALRLRITAMAQPDREFLHRWLTAAG
jgi:adenylate cyclase